VTATDRVTVPAPRATREPVIDADVHEMLASAEQLLPYLPAQWHRYVKSGWTYPFFFTYGYPTDAGFARLDAVPRVGPAGSDYGLMREQLLEEHTVEVAILTSLFFPGDMRVQTEFGNALASAYNDWVTETWLARDSRFRGSICVNASDPEAAAREIDRVGDRPEYIQVILGPMNRGYGEPRFAPILAAAARHDLAVAIHGSARAETAIGYPELLSEWRVLGPPQHHQAQLVSLVFHGAFERHPSLRVVFVEGGWSWLPHVLWRMDENYRALRIEMPWLKRMPREYVLEHVRFTTQPMESLTAEQLMQLLDHIGSDEILLFSSDYPHWDFDASSRVLPSGMPKATVRKIQYENAKAWYAL
jgi:predicted TIM-barrel fold metal-dependent hydrolase